MAKSGHSSVHQRSGGHPPPPRSEHAVDDDRPFAEIRKLLLSALGILSLHRWAFFIPFCLVSSIMFISSLYSPRTYTASVRFERRTDAIAKDLDDPAGMPMFLFFRSTMVDDLKSEEYMSDVVENLGLTEGFERDADGNLTEASIARRNALARSLGNRLWIWTNVPDGIGDVDQIEITYTGPDPHIGRRLVEEVKKTFIRRTRKWVRDRLNNRRDYYARQFEEAEKELIRARREETRLRLENGLVDPTKPETIGIKLSQLERERKTLLTRQRGHETDLTAQRQMLAMLDPGVMATDEASNQEAEFTKTEPISPRSSRFAEEIRRINLEIERLRSTRGMTHLHPEIVELVETRRGFEAELEQQRISDGGQAVADRSVAAERADRAAFARIPVQRWQIDRAQTIVKIAALEEKIRDVGIELESNEVTVKELLDIKGNVFQKQEEYVEVTSRATKARDRCSQLETLLVRINPVLVALEQDRLVMFTEGPQARGSSIPIAPRAKDIVILSLLLGIAAGIACVVLAEVLDHVYRSTGQVARSLGLPILEAIDEIVTAQDRRRRLVNKLVVAPLILACGLGITCLTGSMAYLSLSRPSTYQKLRGIPQAAIEFFAGDTTDCGLRIEPPIPNPQSVQDFLEPLRL